MGFHYSYILVNFVSDAIIDAGREQRRVKVKQAAHRPAVSRARRRPRPARPASCRSPHASLTVSAHFFIISELQEN